MALLSAASQASPVTVSSQHAELEQHSVARQGASSDPESERKDLVKARKSFARQSVAGQRQAHRELRRQDVAGQRPVRRKIAAGSASHLHTVPAAAVHKSPS
jgi:hypothetical protein